MNDEQKVQTADEEKNYGLPDNWVPIDAPPIVPGINSITDGSSKYLQGSLPPSFQHDVSFTGTQHKSDRTPSLSLMPLGVQGNPASNAAVQSTSGQVTAQAISQIPSSPPQTDIDTGDGLVHGDAVWEYDSAYTILRDDFSLGGSGGGSLGDLNWKQGGTGTPSVSNYNGAFPYMGQIEIYTGVTTANNNAFIAPSAALTAGSLVRSAWDTAMPLLDYPGWKLTWVFCVRRPDPNNGGSHPAFDATRLSMYIGLGNGNGAPGSTALSLDPRPNVFFGCRFDTDTSAPSIGDTTFVLEACINAINTSVTTRYNNQGTLGGTFNTGVSLVEGAMHRLEIICIAAGQVTITLDGVGATFTVSKLVSSLANNAITVSNGESTMPTAVVGGFTNTNGYTGVATGSLVAFAGGSLPVAYAGTFPVIQDDTGSSILIKTPAGGGGGGVTGAYTMTAYPGLYPIASIAQDSTGGSAGIFSRSLVVDYFSLVWNKGLATGAPSPNSSLPRYW